jgi:hypothetical protein
MGITAVAVIPALVQRSGPAGAPAPVPTVG